MAALFSKKPDPKSGDEDFAPVVKVLGGRQLEAPEVNGFNGATVKPLPAYYMDHLHKQK